MLQKYFLQYFPRQLAFPKRTKPIPTYNKLIQEVNRWNGIKNIYYSIYDCDEFGRFDNAHIDKVVFDFDNKEQSQKLLQKIIPKLLKLKWKFSIFFSGNKGFHLYIFTNPNHPTKNLKDVLYNIQYYIINKLNIPDNEVDNHLLGDIARVIRFPNTLHLKSNLFAIPLSVEDITQLSFEQIREKASKPNLKIYIYGTEFLNLHDFDYTSRRREIVMPEYNYNFNIEITDELLQKVFNKLHPCVKLWLTQPEKYCKNETRWYYALYMTHMGYPDEIAVALAKRFWGNVKETGGNRTKFQEFMQERQLYYAKVKNQVVPNCETLFERGWCKGKCKYFQRHNFPIYKK